MIERIDGNCYKSMLDYGIRNLNMHRSALNRLNVFPVPDGDTGTNMVTTIKKGFFGIDENENLLSEVSKAFANRIIFEARGNSGVIVSQFLKGLSETFFEAKDADSRLFIKALENGSDCARSSVANPVEGTMLTVIREATEAVKRDFENGGCKGIDGVVELFVKYAKSSLENTPELLPALKKAGVVDSGGAGIVYLFEGMQKYFSGKEIEPAEYENQNESVDWTQFNKESVFDYGYCTELLIQLLHSKEQFDFEQFKNELSKLGDSIVTVYRDDKVKIHIHSKQPEKVLEFCHRFGEFLSLKIENMSVGHTENLNDTLLCSQNEQSEKLAVVAVAFDRAMQRLLVQMGADAVIYSDKTASTKDFLDAFEKISSENILVFPNSSDSVLTALMAKNIYEKANVYVIESNSITECYAALPTVDFESEDLQAVVSDVSDIVKKLYTVTVMKRNDACDSDGDSIRQGEYCAFSGKEIISLAGSLEEAVVSAIEKTLASKEKEIITLFHDESILPASLENIKNAIEKTAYCVEIFTVLTEKMPFTISFE